MEGRSLQEQQEELKHHNGTRAAAGASPSRMRLAAPHPPQRQGMRPNRDEETPNLHRSSDRAQHRSLRYPPCDTGIDRHRTRGCLEDFTEATANTGPGCEEGEGSPRHAAALKRSAGQPAHPTLSSETRRQHPLINGRAAPPPTKRPYHNPVSSGVASLHPIRCRRRRNPICGGRR